MKTLLRLAVFLLCAVPAFADTRLTAVALPQGGHSLSWNASPTTGVTYNLYRRDAPCTSASGTFTRVNTTPITGLTFADSGAPSGKVCYVVRAQDVDGGESIDSNRVSLPDPAPPTNLRKTP